MKDKAHHTQKPEHIISCNVVIWPGKEYATLAYILDKSGFPVKRAFATRGSPLEQQMKADGQAWLMNESEP